MNSAKFLQFLGMVFGAVVLVSMGCGFFEKSVKETKNQRSARQSTTTQKPTADGFAVPGGQDYDGPNPGRQVSEETLFGERLERLAKPAINPQTETWRRSNPNGLNGDRGKR